MSDSNTRIEAWKTFLKGRIEQEKGNNEEALKAFETALKIEPTNTAFLNAKANALAKLGKPEEALISQISAGYLKLAMKLVGKDDKPESWINGIKELQKKAESLDKKSILVDMCW